MSVIHTALPGARVLDLFAGSGALGLEALSRGAAEVTFVENDPRAIAALRKNLATLGGDDRATIVRTDAVRFVTGLAADAFEIAFADPPYEQGLATAERGGTPHRPASPRRSPRCFPSPRSAPPRPSPKCLKS